MTALDDAPARSERPAGRLRLLLNHPLSTYYLVAGATLMLLALGLVMVLSASSIESYRVFGSAYTLAQRQGMFAVIGVVAMIFASRTTRGFPSAALAISPQLIMPPATAAAVVVFRNVRRVFMIFFLQQTNSE